MHLVRLFLEPEKTVGPHEGGMRAATFCHEQRGGLVLPAAWHLHVDLARSGVEGPALRGASGRAGNDQQHRREPEVVFAGMYVHGTRLRTMAPENSEIGRASCREREWQYV